MEQTCKLFGDTIDFVDYIVLLCVCDSYLVPEEHQVEFIEKKDHAVVLNVLKRFKDSENVVLSALQVLIPLAEPGKKYCIDLFCAISV